MAQPPPNMTRYCSRGGGEGGEKGGGEGGGEGGEEGGEEQVGNSSCFTKQSKHTPTHIY